MLFTQLSGKCQGKTRKDGARPALFLVVVLLYVFFVLFYMFLRSLYCLFCNVSCIVCVYMCTVLLPPGGYPIAVKYISSNSGPGSVVGIATGYGLDGPGIESRWGARFSATVQTGPGAHPGSCTIGTGSFPGVKSGRRVTLTPHPLLVPLVMKE